MKSPHAAHPNRRRTFFLLLAASVIVVLASSQVGGEREFLALLTAAAAIVGLLAIIRPHWIVFIGASLAFAGGYAVVGIPVPELGALLIIGGTLAMKRDGWHLPGALVILVPLLLTWALFIAWPMITQQDANKRLLSITLWALLLLVLALPGLARRYVAMGLLTGLLISLPAGVIVGSSYGARFAGLINDPNFFAMVVAVTTPLIVGQLGFCAWRAAGIWGLSAVMVVLADSRTGMLSFATAIVVFYTVQRLRGWVIGVPLLGLWTAANLPDDYVRGGRWEDRAGSDALRVSIDSATTRQIADSPWIGHGLGRGSVSLAEYGDPPRDLTFLLHNSYKLMVTEMGFVGMSIYTLIASGAVVAALRGVVARGPLAAIAAAGVMATQLGEVLFAVQVALAFGFAWGSSRFLEDVDKEASTPSISSGQTHARAKPVPA